MKSCCQRCGRLMVVGMIDFERFKLVMKYGYDVCFDLQLHVFLLVCVYVTFAMSLIPFMHIASEECFMQRTTGICFGSRSMTCWLKILRSKSARLRKKNVQ